MQLSYHGGVAVNIEFFLTGHPFLFLGREGGIKGFHRGGILTAIGGGRSNVHPLFAVQHTRHKLADKQRSGEIAGNDKNYLSHIVLDLLPAQHICEGTELL